MEAKHWLALGAIVGLGAEIPACSSKFSSCTDSRTCVEEASGGAGASGAGGSSAGGNAGTSGVSHGDSGAGNVGDAGAGGSAGQEDAEAGAGGTVEPPVTECVPSVRDCGSPADNDCNGVPDNTKDSVCQSDIAR